MVLEVADVQLINCIMKMIKIPFGMILALSSCIAAAQGVSQDSLASLAREKETIEVRQKLNEYKTDLAKAQSDLVKATEKSRQAVMDAERAAENNRQIAAQLSRDPQNKKLGNDASKAAREAQRKTRDAKRASESLAKLEKEVGDLTTKISEQETTLSATGAVSAAPQTQVAARPAQVQPEASTQQPVVISNQPQSVQPAPAVQPAPQVQNWQPAGAPASADPARDIAQRVVEQTYKALPQQGGQPPIIINNIIIPSDYNRPAAAPVAAAQPTMPSTALNLTEEERQEFEEYRMWLRERRAGNTGQGYARTAPPASGGFAEERHGGFRERFAERPVRRSGMWVIPMAGIHASDFDANFKDNEAKGRTGWNAGLDFRIHMKRFFIQPGVHYFNSSMDLTSKDSISDAPLLSGPRIHSLKVPLMIGTYLTKEQGAFFKFNIKGGIVGNYVLAVDKNNQQQFTKDNIEEYSYGVNGGIGLEFGLITLDLSHEWGLSRYFKDTNGKNNILRATLGIKL